MWLHETGAGVWVSDTAPIFYACPVFSAVDTPQPASQVPSDSDPTASGVCWGSACASPAPLPAPASSVTSCVPVESFKAVLDPLTHGHSSLSPCACGSVALSFQDRDVEKVKLFYPEFPTLRYF